MARIASLKIKCTRERDKPLINGFGIPVSLKIWKSTDVLEKAELNIFLDVIPLDCELAKMR